MSSELVLIDEPVPHVRRITMNRPEKRNALNHPLRGAILDAVRTADQDPDIHVSIIRGAGPSFSAGYDLAGGNEGHEYPYYTPGGEGQWPRHVTDGWMSIWDLAKPVIAQVHGLCIGGATELAQACDLVYVAADAKISYPVVRVLSPPDWPYHTALLGMRRAMELMLTGDPLSGEEAVTVGWANRVFPADSLDDDVLHIASRIGGVAPDLLQINKRLVHRQADILGTRAAIRAGSELQALAGRQESVQAMRGNALEAMKQANAAQR